MEKNFYNLTDREFLLKVDKRELNYIYCRNADELVSIVKFIDSLFNVQYQRTRILENNYSFPLIIKLSTDREEYYEHEWNSINIRNPMNFHYDRIRTKSSTIRYEEAVMAYDQRKDEKYARVKTNGFTLQLIDVDVFLQNITEIKDENELTEIKTKTYKENLMKGFE